MEVLTMGRVIVDLYAEQLHTPLEAVTGFTKYLGGSAGNMAVGLARLGATVGLASRVGPDEFGRFLLDRLEREGVSTAMVKVDPTYPTPLAFAAIFPPADSKVLFYGKPCAYNRLSPEDLDGDLVRGLKVLALGGTALCAAPSREAAFVALEMNRASAGLTVMDVDWRPSQWEEVAHARIWYRQALRYVDTVLANAVELEFLGGSADPGEAARSIMTQGPRQVIAKRGGGGVRVFGEGEPLEVAPFRVEVMNTLGAGDGFGAGFCFGLLQNWSLKQRLTFANAAGGLVVSRHSCSEAMPNRREVQALIASQQREL